MSNTPEQGASATAAVICTNAVCGNERIVGYVGRPTSEMILSGGGRLL